MKVRICWCAVLHFSVIDPAVLLDIVWPMGIWGRYILLSGLVVSLKWAHALHMMTMLSGIGFGRGRGIGWSFEFRRILLSGAWFIPMLHAFMICLSVLVDVCGWVVIRMVYVIVFLLDLCCTLGHWSDCLSDSAFWILIVMNCDVLLFVDLPHVLRVLVAVLDCVFVVFIGTVDAVLLGFAWIWFVICPIVCPIALFGYSLSWNVACFCLWYCKIYYVWVSLFWIMCLSQFLLMKMMYLWFLPWIFSWYYGVCFVVAHTFLVGMLEGGNNFVCCLRSGFWSHFWSLIMYESLSHLVMWFDLPNKLSIGFIAFMYDWLCVKLITLSGFEAWSTDSSVYFMRRVVTYWVRIVPDLFFLILFPVCVTGVDAPLGMIFCRLSVRFEFSDISDVCVGSDPE